MNSFKTKYRSVFFVVLCSLLFCACTQETKAPLENAAPLSETATETTTEKEELSAPPQETETPDLSGAKNADETLALLIKDEGFRKRVRYGTDLAEDDPPEKVLQKLENCESIMLDEPGRGNPIYSLESLSLLPNLKRLVIRISQWDESVITDFTPIAQLSHLEQLYISYEKDEQIDLSFLGGMHTITELFLTQCKVTDFSFLEQMSQLQRLSLYETPVNDLAVLENLPQLVELALSGNKNAAHMETVGTLTKMQDLGIQDCGIEDISFLSGLTELRCVNLNNN